MLVRKEQFTKVNGNEKDVNNLLPDAATPFFKGPKGH